MVRGRFYYTEEEAEATEREAAKNAAALAEVGGMVVRQDVAVFPGMAGGSAMPLEPTIPAAAVAPVITAPDSGRAGEWRASADLHVSDDDRVSEEGLAH